MWSVFDDDDEEDEASATKDSGVGRSNGIMPPNEEGVLVFLWLRSV